MARTDRHFSEERTSAALFVIAFQLDWNKYIQFSPVCQAKFLIFPKAFSRKRGSAILRNPSVQDYGTEGKSRASVWGRKQAATKESM